MPICEPIDEVLLYNCERYAYIWLSFFSPSVRVALVYFLIHSHRVSEGKFNSGGSLLMDISITISLILPLQDPL